MTPLAGPLKEAFRTCLNGMADLLLPQTCAACGAAEVAAEGLCSECNLELLSLVALPACPRCGGTLGPNVPAREDGCGQCATTLPRFERTFRLGPYAGCLATAIRDLKYHRRLHLRRRFARLLARRVSAGWDGPAFDLVLPVPMHWWRRLQRGFDHARSVAGRVAAELKLPLGTELVRVRDTPPQTRLPRTRRIENVRGAFAVRSRATVRGASVLVVDDVTTTGATANEAARTLLAAGAHRVVLAVFAKAEAPTAYAHALRQG